MTELENNSQRRKQTFEIAKIEETKPPGNITGGEWYKFTIDHPASPIMGLRSGSLQSVRQHLEEYVENLNSRAIYGRSAYATKKVKR